MGWRDIAVDTTPLRRSKRFRILFLSSGLSSLGSRFTDVAVPYEVYHLTHSTLAVGLLGGASLLPRVVGSVLGGAIADVHDRRRVIMATEAAALVLVALLALNSGSGHPQTWVIFLLSVALVGSATLGLPAAQSLVPLAVEPDQVPGAAALASMSYSVGWLVGPALAGVVIAAAGTTTAFLIDAASYLGALALMRLMEPMAAGAPDESVGWSTIVDGARAVVRDQVLVGSFLLDIDAMVFGLPLALFPAIAAEHFGNRPIALGLLYTAPFAGSLVASGSSGWTRRIVRRGWGITWSVVVWGFAIAAFGLSHSLLGAFAFLAVAGGADMISGVFRQALLADATPPDRLGRVFGLGLAVWSGGPSLGDLEAGIVARLFGVTASAVSGGLLAVGGALVITAVLPRFRAYRRVPAEAPR